MFNFVLIEEVPVEKLLEVEDKYIPFGEYNICKKAGTPPNTSPIEKECRTCNKKFMVGQADDRCGKGKFCSKDCLIVHRSKGITYIVCEACGL